MHTRGAREYMHMHVCIHAGIRMRSVIHAREDRIYIGSSKRGNSVLRNFRSQSYYLKLKM